MTHWWTKRSLLRPKTSSVAISPRHVQDGNYIAAGQKFRNLTPNSTTSLDFAHNSTPLQKFCRTGESLCVFSYLCHALLFFSTPRPLPSSNPSQRHLRSPRPPLVRRRLHSVPPNRVGMRPPTGRELGTGAPVSSFFLFSSMLQGIIDVQGQFGPSTRVNSTRWKRNNII
jgi:hypothetical protein